MTQSEAVMFDWSPDGETVAFGGGERAVHLGISAKTSARRRRRRGRLRGDAAHDR
jgi:hypothetical protein